MRSSTATTIRDGLIVSTRIIVPMTVESWTEETRGIEAAALVMLLDPHEREQALDDAAAMLDVEETAPAAVSILEALIVHEPTLRAKAAQTLLDWLGE
jgi:hypothetical protein